MKLKLVREGFSPKATEGRLYVDGLFECYTLEDKDRFLEAGGVKMYGQTAIPRGTYDVKLTNSERFLKVLPLLVNVPMFSGIRIHAGNSANDTDGCILVGRRNIENNDNWIEDSKSALTALMSKLMVADDITIEIV